MSKRNLHKTMTSEDKFARKYYCNSYRFVSDMKRRNRKRMRRKLKKEDEVIRWQIQRLSQKLDEV